MHMKFAENVNTHVLSVGGFALIRPLTYAHAILQAAQERSDLVPLELVAIDDDALDKYAPHSPFSIIGDTFRIAYPSASGPHTLDGLWQVRHHTDMSCIAKCLDLPVDQRSLQHENQ